jgi:quercetin dioxygenase-like cupin family protein
MAVDPQPARRRRPKRFLAPLALAVVPALAVAAVAAGHQGPPAPPPAGGGPSGVTIEPLVHATIPDPVRVNDDGIKIKTDGPRDALGTKITVVPGGTFGWHTHPGPVFVAVASGTLSLYEPSHHNRSCDKTNVAPGQAFIEGGGHVHLARNEGSEPVQLYATFLAAPGTTEFLTTVPDPGACSV